jgi:23S rRNA pseudouridine2605 synthase
MLVRLQKILSTAGVASRRASEKLIVEGRVSVNGQTIRELGSKADPDADDIRVDERRVKGAQRLRYFLLNKPTGYVTTRSDPEQRPTVLDLLKGVREYVYPVGRLDYDSEGLLILTNDGDLAATLTHPRHEVERVYEAQVLGVPDAHDLDRLARGVVVEGRRTAPARIELVHDRHRESQLSKLRVTIHEGRTRQVRRMCDAIGHPVRTLKRVRIGPLTDPKLKPGTYRELSPAEVARLKSSGRSVPKHRDTKTRRTSS